MINSKDSEPWSFGEEVEEISANYIRLRYKLMPYIYSAFVEAAETGTPVARSLVIDYTQDEKIYGGEFDNQYLFGKSILVAPIGSHDQFIKMYLPEGEWYEFFTDEKFDGNQELIREYTLEELPLFVKGSAIIPIYPNAHTNVQGTGDTLELHVYNGSKPNTFNYYEDDGTSYDFENGNYHRRNVVFDPQQKELRLEKAEGSFDSRISELKVVFHGFNDEEMSSIKEISDESYAFVQPISDFDPFENPLRGKLKIDKVKTLTMKYAAEELKISWQ